MLKVHTFQKQRGGDYCSRFFFKASVDSVRSRTDALAGGFEVRVIPVFGLQLPRHRQCLCRSPPRVQLLKHPDEIRVACEVGLGKWRKVVSRFALLAVSGVVEARWKKPIEN